MFRWLLLLLLVPSALHSQTPENGHEQWEYALVDSGDVLQLALPAGALTYSLLKKDYEGSKDFLLSYGTAMTLTYSLKYIVHKQRPEGRDRYDSFPSGHTCSAFAGAAFIQRRYGWKWGKFAYPLAALVGISRVEGPYGYHDYWDVLAGAAIGVGSVYLFTKPYEPSQVQVGFTAHKNFKGVSVTWSF
ncbi:MAG: phosphatase PAP2 family protein [Flavobacteriaceae bacterium]